jgi:hypothetical protein
MPQSELYWDVLWWISGASFEPEQQYEGTCTSFVDLPNSVIQEKGSLNIIIHEIRRTLAFSDYCKVMPWSWDCGAIPDEVSLAELMDGRYGEISREKPLTFVLIGAWTFDMTLERAELISMIDTYANPEIGILEDCRQQLERDRALTATRQTVGSSEQTLTQTLSMERNDLELQNHLPLYGASEEGTDNGVTRHTEPLESLLDLQTVEPSSDMDAPPPYSELPPEFDTASLPEPSDEPSASDITLQTLLPATTNPFSPPVPLPLPRPQRTTFDVYVKLDHLCAGVSLPGAFPQD